ncbi:relaxase/mobilization nuclease domain-containing protein [Propionimicrobium sp. PCR01-08-3]|uniref:relaxase/mobilization nuclease domain-containing protein n=1 Tax=Propionimicrobium sp. PCR01-08-3 TaxID=3052086 RepID=UPI00255C538B|nr:relaxase/mobilization nuclease domain-containing protein [Propionimicrobium sp. PCR01-08-3]WIY83939.1 relaxase/mobilization nuclease domain-containing protein [Propionimicrobium sp. PCR01-08-3]
MSTTHIAPVYDLGTRADYLEMGVGAKKRDHAKAGTNRIAPGFHCDAGSIDEFIELGNRLAAGHKRRVKAHGMLVNFHPDELDVRNPDDLQRGGDLALELARRAFPNSPTMVVVHDDADGGHVHAHVVILNHDLVSGLAPKKNRTHAAIKRLNDTLMREEGMRVVDDQYVAAREKWTDRRADLQAFEQSIGDRVAEAKEVALKGDLAAFNEVFEAECKTRGVDVVRTEHVVDTDAREGRRKGDVEVGITYVARDEVTPGKRPRRRRKAASKLSSEFTDAGLQQAVEAERQRRAAEAQRQAAEVQRQQRVAATAAAPPRSREELRAEFLKRTRDDEVEADTGPLAPLSPAEEQGEPQDDAVEAEVEPLAPLPADPAAVAPLPPTDEAVEETETPALATARAGHVGALAPLTPATNERYRSPIRDQQPKRDRDQAYLDRIAAVDEHVVERTEARKLIDAAVLKNVGRRDISSFRAVMHAATVETLEARETMKAAASRAYEEGNLARVKALRTAMAEGRFYVVEREDEEPVVQPGGERQYGD